jgi:hypothetical protein
MDALVALGGKLGRPLRESMEEILQGVNNTRGMPSALAKLQAAARVAAVPPAAALPAVGFLAAGLLVIGCLAVVSPASGSTTPDNQNLKVALHVRAHETRTCSKNMPYINGRADLERVWDAYTDVDVFFVVFSYDSLTGVQFGLRWPQDWGSAFTSHCGDLAIGSIRDPGDGLSLTWQTCQTAHDRPRYWPVAWAWLSPASDGEVSVTSHFLTVADCAFLESEPESIFNAGLNVDPYEGPPNGRVATVPATWGAVKAMFR